MRSAASRGPAPFAAASRRAWRWAAGGAALGAAAALLAFAPAAWLAGALADATGQRLLLADARGSVWRGSAVLVLTGGAGSRDASALPGRVQWALGLDGMSLALRATHACCINGTLQLRVVPGLGRTRLVLLAPAGGGAVGQWPASWLAGLGTPWNTLQPSGALRLVSPGMSLEQVQGRWLFVGRVELAADALSARVSTLDELGSYRLTLAGDAAGGGVAQVQLATTGGALQLSGSGQWAAGKLRFTGQAGAAAGYEAALANLLNIIGRRQGALSLISIG